MRRPLASWPPTVLAGATAAWTWPWSSP